MATHAVEVLSHKGNVEDIMNVVFHVKLNTHPLNYVLNWMSQSKVIEGRLSQNQLRSFQLGSENWDPPVSYLSEG